MENKKTLVPAEMLRHPNVVAIHDFSDGAGASSPAYIVMELVEGRSLRDLLDWSAITLQPKLFAAAIPVCGGGDESQATKLVNTSIWAFHGEKDEAVSVERTRRMVEALRKAGGTPRYTEYKDAGHVIWEKVFHEPELQSWMFSQRRAN